MISEPETCLWSLLTIYPTSTGKSIARPFCVYCPPGNVTVVMKSCIRLKCLFSIKERFCRRGGIVPGKRLILYNVALLGILSESSFPLQYEQTLLSFVTSTTSDAPVLFLCDILDVQKGFCCNTCKHMMGVFVSGLHTTNYFWFS